MYCKTKRQAEFVRGVLCFCWGCSRLSQMCSKNIPESCHFEMTSVWRASVRIAKRGAQGMASADVWGCLGWGRQLELARRGGLAAGAQQLWPGRGAWMEQPPHLGTGLVSAKSAHAWPTFSKWGPWGRVGLKSGVRGLFPLGATLEVF